MLTGCVLVNAEHLHGIPEGLPLLKVRPIYKFDTANPIRSRSSHEPVTAAILISIPRQLDNRQCDHEGIAHHYITGSAIFPPAWREIDSLSIPKAIV